MKMTVNEPKTTGGGVLAILPALGTVFVSSASIMVLELVAGRVVARYIGQSLYTWTAIIGLVLAGISLGNYLGGRIADRASGRRTLALQFLAAALACLSILLTNQVLGEWRAMAGLSWPLRIFVHIGGVFFLPATVLGTISPVIAKRALAAGHTTGRTVGDVYAWSIGGSIAGTFLTGFFLLMWAGASEVAVGSAVMMGALGLLYLAGSFAHENGASSVPVKAGPEDGQWSWRDLAIPALTLFLANAGVMAMEMAAGRIVTRTYGQSLYTWTTVIGLILAGMTLGSYVGGRLADRRDPKRLLVTLFILSSVACLAIPPVNRIIVATRMLIALSWPVQIAIQVILAFFLPALVLGAIAPVVVRMALARGGGVGRTVGSLYAWGSAGSIFGTFLAGYFLVAAIGMAATVYAVAAVMAVMALAYGWKRPGAWAWAGALALALCTVYAPWKFLATPGYMLALRQAPHPGAVYMDESQYSYIAVVEEPNAPGVRQMILDRLVHSKVDMSDPQALKYEYEWIYRTVLDTFFPAPEPIAAMVIGGGGYAFPHYLELTRPGGYIEASEIDPAVTEAAHAGLGFPRDTAVKVFNMDARNRIDDLVAANRAAAEPVLFDCIFGDSINDYSVPYHLTTREFNERLATLLKPNGLYLLNLIDMRDSGLFLGSIVATCRETFPHVYAFSCRNRTNDRDTFVVVSAREPLDVEDIPDRIRANYPEYVGAMVEPALLDEIAQRPGVHVLTDNFAPVDNMLAPVVRLSQDTRNVTLVHEADVMLTQGQFEEAERLTGRVLRSWPESDEARKIRGAALLQLGRAAEAVEELRKAADKAPQDPYVASFLAQALFAAGDPEAGIAAWTRAIELKPDDAGLRAALGAVLVQAGRAEEARDVLTKAVELAPDSLAAHNNLAVAQFNLGNFEGAARELREVLRIDPKHAGVYPQLAIACWKLKDYDAAWAAVRAARAAGDPVSAEFLQALATDSGRRE